MKINEDTLVSDAEKHLETIYQTLIPQITQGSRKITVASLKVALLVISDMVHLKSYNGLLVQCIMLNSWFSSLIVLLSSFIEDEYSFDLS